MPTSETSGWELKHIFKQVGDIAGGSLSKNLMFSEGLASKSADRDLGFSSEDRELRVVATDIENRKFGLQHRSVETKTWALASVIGNRRTALQHTTNIQALASCLLNYMANAHFQNETYDNGTISFSYIVLVYRTSAL